MRLQRFWPALLAAGTALLCDGGAVRAEGPTASVELPRFVRPQKPMTDEAVDDALAVPPVEYGKWQGTGYGAYLAPKRLDVGPDGGVDVMLHLNGAMMADKEWRESGLNAVVASIAIREIVGSAGYAKLFAEPGYLDYVLRSTLADLQKNGEKRVTHVRRLGVVSWSAGMGGVSQLWAAPALARIDSVVLLDSIHATYTDPKSGVARVAVPGQAAMGLGADWVDMKAVSKYVRLANEAAEGKKAFVIGLGHSSARLRQLRRDLSRGAARRLLAGHRPRRRREERPGDDPQVPRRQGRPPRPWLARRRPPRPLRPTPPRGRDGPHLHRPPLEQDGREP